MKDFFTVFGNFPQATASAPGRVNLLGEHTDYNDGFVLPIAIPQTTSVQVGPSHDQAHHFYSSTLDQCIHVLPGEYISEGFARYIFGCLEVLIEAGYQIPPLNLHVASSVPMGVGLSSSAALEVATLRALSHYVEIPLDAVEIALLAQKAEIHYAGVECGIMDQMASSLADRTHLLFLDTRNLEHRLLPLPEGSQVLAIDSGVTRRLTETAYNQRRRECREAAQQLGVATLRDVSDSSSVESLGEPWRSRARHVLSENARVLEAHLGVSPERFGQLMNASHESLSNDFDVSIPALDTLVNILQKTDGVFGARLTGAGFGGACVALVRTGTGKAVAKQVLSNYSLAGYQGRELITGSEHSN